MVHPVRRAALAVLLLTGSCLSALSPVSAQGGSVLTVDASDPQAFASIQAAINASQPGDTIEVAGGTYPEALRVNHTLSLRALGPVTLSDALHPGVSAITLTGGYLSLEGFTIDYRQQGGHGIEVPATEVFFSDHQGAPGQPGLALRNVTLRPGQSGVRGDVDSLHMEDVRVEGAGAAGVHVEAFGNVTLRRVMANDTAGPGLWVAASNHSLVEEAVVVRAGQTGIDADGAFVVVQDSNVTDSQGGISAFGEGSVLLQRNTVSGVEWFAVDGYSPIVTILDNTVSDSSGDGILGYSDYDGGTVELSRNQATRVGDERFEVPVFADSEKGPAIAEDNLVTDSSNGIWVWSDVSATVRNNTAQRVGGSAIDVEWSWNEFSPTVLDVSGNVVEDSGFSIGVIGTPSSQSTIRDNTVRRASDIGIYSEAGITSVVDNRVDGAVEAGIMFWDVVDGLLRNATVTNVTGHGIEVRNGFGDGPVEVADNVVHNVTGSGIEAQGPVFTITRNQLDAAGNGISFRQQGATEGASLVADNRIRANGPLGIDLHPEDHPVVVAGNDVGLTLPGAAMRIRTPTDLGAVAVKDNVMSADVGILLELSGQAPVSVSEYPYRFNDLRNTTVPFASCGAASNATWFVALKAATCFSMVMAPAGSARLNYYGPHGPPAGLAEFAPVGVEPFLTAAPDPERMSDDVETFGFFLQVDPGVGPIAVGAPTAMARSLHDMFDPGFEGVYYAFDHAAQQWVQTVGDEVLGPLDARVVVPATPSRVLVDFADGPVVQEERVLPAGWNFQGARQFSRASDAFDGGAGNATLVEHLFKHATRALDHHGEHYIPLALDEEWLPGPPIDPRDDVDCSIPANPLGGYFVDYAAPTTVSTVIPVGATVEGYVFQLINLFCFFAPEGSL